MMDCLIDTTESHSSSKSTKPVPTVDTVDDTGTKNEFAFYLDIVHRVQYQELTVRYLPVPGTTTASKNFDPTSDGQNWIRIFFVVRIAFFIEKNCYTVHCPSYYKNLVPLRRSWQ